MRPRPRLTWALLAGMLLAACAGGQRATTPAQQIPGDPERGRVALVEYGCASCHAIPGVPGADNQVGPPLAGWPHRRIIAGRLPNTPENVAAWVQDPQDIDPGNVMPDVGVSAEDAEHIAAYLYSLR